MKPNLTPTQLMLLSDLGECGNQWVFSKRTADALIRKGLADYSGKYLRITPAGRAALTEASK